MSQWDSVRVEPAPAPRPTGRPPSLGPLLATIARDHPNTDVRIDTKPTMGAARVLASKLRTGKRGVEGRPAAGTWVFTAAQIVEGPDAGLFGVWAHYTPEDTL